MRDGERDGEVNTASLVSSSYFGGRGEQACACPAQVRLNWLATALVALSQGVPFFHAGDELLRSKSLDRDSYNSGDWFNALDWSAASNNFGAGLPPAGKNAANWAFMRPLLADAANQPPSKAIAATAEHFRAMLQVRASSPLLRLRTAADVAQRLRFFNAGPGAVPGLLLWTIRDGGVPPASAQPSVHNDNAAKGGSAGAAEAADVCLEGGAGAAAAPAQAPVPVLDARHACLVVAINATQAEIVMEDAALAAQLGGASFTLHPALAHLGDEALSRAAWDGARLTVPRLSAVVLCCPH